MCRFKLVRACCNTVHIFIVLALWCVSCFDHTILLLLLLFFSCKLYTTFLITDCFFLCCFFLLLLGFDALELKIFWKRLYLYKVLVRCLDNLPSLYSTEYIIIFFRKNSSSVNIYVHDWKDHLILTWYLPNQIKLIEKCWTNLTSRS